MNKKAIIITSAIVGGVGIFAYSIYRYIKVQTSLLKKFSYTILDFGIQQFDNQLIKGVLKVLFTNTSDVEIVIEEFYLDFYFDGNNVGYLTDTNRFVIPANGSAPISFEYNLNPQLIIGNLTDMFAYYIGENDAYIEIVGYVSVKSGFLRVTLPVSYGTMVSDMLKGT